jgi:pimeloyl-ACP methyl ester carboxylesterase
MKPLVRLSAAVLAGLLAACLPPGAEAKESRPKSGDPEGLWLGTLRPGLFELRVAVRLEHKKDGPWAGTFYSIDQGPDGVAIDAVAVKDGRLHFEVKKNKGVYEGVFDEDGSTIRGRWRQGGPKVPLTFRRTDKLPVLARPQNPRKPYPYAEHEVAFENKRAGVKLAGALTVPRGRGPFPAVVLLSGSGPQDRDETIFGHKPFLVIADHLTRHGVAVLRLDDRGVGGSGGDTFKSTINDLCGDALAAVAFLKGRKEIDPRKIGLVGHSEGGYVAPLAASRSGDVAFIVLLAGPGLPGEEILYLQGQAILKSLGGGKEDLKRARALQEMMFTVIKREKDDDRARKLILRRLDEEMAGPPARGKKQPDDLGARIAGGLESVLGRARRWAEKPILTAAIKEQTKLVLTPWFRFLLTYDPRPALHKVRVPVLALIGEKDLQVPAKENLKALRKALEEGGNKDITLKEMPGLNHLFQTCKTGSLVEYGRIEETFAPAALEEIAGWIRERTR